MAQRHWTVAPSDLSTPLGVQRENTMSTQDRVPLARSERAPMEGAQLIGPSDPHEKMAVTVYLRRGSEPGVYPNIALLGSLPVNERHHLSREEFAKAHGASADDLESTSLRRGVWTRSQRGKSGPPFRSSQGN